MPCQGIRVFLKMYGDSSGYLTPFLIPWHVFQAERILEPAEVREKFIRVFSFAWIYLMFTIGGERGLRQRRNGVPVNYDRAGEH